MIDKEIIKIAQIIEEQDEAEAEEMGGMGMDMGDEVSPDEVEEEMGGESDLDKLVELLGLLQEKGIDVAEFIDICLEKLQDADTEMDDEEMDMGDEEMSGEDDEEMPAMDGENEDEEVPFEDSKVGSSC